MEDSERIERLELVVKTLIAWLSGELGEVARDKLLDMLNSEDTNTGEVVENMEMAYQEYKPWKED